MILRACVVIPSFDQPRTISEVVKDVVNETAFPILIIDDGSEIPAANVLYSFEVKQALEVGRVRVVRFENHRGRGAALQYAVQDLASAGFTHMVTFDGAGAFKASEIIKLAEQARRNPWSLIIGNRGLEDAETKSGWRELSKRLWRSLVNFETGSQIQDARSTLRMYPLFSTQTMQGRTNFGDWELEILIRLLWKGVRVCEVNVEEVGGGKEGANALAMESNPFLARQSSTFDAVKQFWKGTRVWVMNGVLISLSLLKTHADARELALAMGLGVFVGCTPVYGFHTLIVVVLAIVLRMNFVALWAGTHISTPVLFPFLFMSEVYIAQHWFGIPASTGIMGHFYQWLVGSLVLGLGLGVASALITYYVARSMQKPPEDLESDDRFDSNHYRFRRFLLSRFGIVTTYWWVRMTAPLKYLRVRVRGGLSEYYKLTQPKLSFWERQKKIFVHLQRQEEVQTDRLIGEDLVRWKRIQEVNGGNSSFGQNGKLVLTAHLGSWRMAKGSAEKSPVFYGDRGERHELIPFLGKLAVFDVSAFAQAAQEKIPLGISFGVKTGHDVYTLFSQQPRFYEWKSDQAAEVQVYDWATRFVHQLEFFVRRYPDQWFNLYPFWSTVPPKESAPAVFVEELQGRAEATDAVSPLA